MENSQQTQMTVPPGQQPLGAALPSLTDEDFALGCECANPVLQIDCWMQESARSKPERS
jgi:hypothetical protein